MALLSLRSDFSHNYGRALGGIYFLTLRKIYHAIPIIDANFVVRVMFKLLDMMGGSGLIKLSMELYSGPK